MLLKLNIKLTKISKISMRHICWLESVSDVGRAAHARKWQCLGVNQSQIAERRAIASVFAIEVKSLLTNEWIDVMATSSMQNISRHIKGTYDSCEIWFLPRDAYTWNACMIRYRPTGWPKNWHHILYALTSSNINRFSKLFQWGRLHFVRW